MKVRKPGDGFDDGEATAPAMEEASLCEELNRVYEAVDLAAEALIRLHGPRLRCRRGCRACCIDGLTVFEVEAMYIQHRHARLLEEEEAHPEGACAFLSPEGDCRIHESRPYVCRTQGLPLRWIEEASEGEMVELRDICPINDPGPPVEELPERACWSIGPVEECLARLQGSRDDGRLRRIRLRSLFRHS
ncbi:MAG: YkgJ family cysteine cluster protein [Syntrophobacteraceae bacterium]|jgi:Fe-S-cluster containining protein|nr:YkgJ family cysteine cluster protein [Syntrophobacteraceae bacterium]